MNRFDVYADRDGHLFVLLFAASPTHVMAYHKHRRRCKAIADIERDYKLTAIDGRSVLFDALKYNSIAGITERRIEFALKFQVEEIVWKKQGRWKLPPTEGDMT